MAVENSSSFFSRTVNVPRERIHFAEVIVALCTEIFCLFVCLVLIQGPGPAA